MNALDASNPGSERHGFCAQRSFQEAHLFGLLIEDSTLTGGGYAVTMDLRMRGSTTLTLHSLSLPRPIAQTAQDTLAIASTTVLDNNSVSKLKQTRLAITGVSETRV